LGDTVEKSQIEFALLQDGVELDCLWGNVGEGEYYLARFSAAFLEGTQHCQHSLVYLLMVGNYFLEAFSFDAELQREMTLEEMKNRNRSAEHEL
jgi:hypothetical protein